MSSLPEAATRGLPPNLDIGQASQAVYYEEQYMRQRWVWVVLILSTVLVFALPFLPIDEDAGSREAILAGTLSGGLMLLIMLAMWRIRLRIWVTPDGVHIRYWPFVRHRVVPFSDITAFGPITYSPMNYGGWGVRGTADDRVYNASGNQGVRLLLGDRKKLLLGSQRAEELANAIQQASGQSMAPSLR